MSFLFGRPAGFRARRRLLTAAVLWVACAVVGCGDRAAKTERERRAIPPRNVLLVTIDTLRADHLGIYGYQRDTSPHLDRLARESIVFEQAIVQWPKTSPSMASMFTSTYGNRNGVMRKCRQRIERKFDLLAELFQRGGYQTAAVVTNANLGRRYQFDQGFDHFDEIWNLGLPEIARSVSDRAVAWLSSHAAEKQFFLWLHYVDPHARYEPPGRFDGMFVGDRHYDPSRVAPIYRRRRHAPPGHIPRNLALGEHQEIDFYVAQYDAEIRYVDEQLARVLQTLDALKLAGNTIVVVTADHGESLGDHKYFFDHGRYAYEACGRVPLIVKLPRAIASPMTVADPVGLIHLAPTLLDAVDLPVPGQFQGRSLVPYLRGEQTALPEYTFTEGGYERNYQRAIRHGRWKLIYVPDPKLRKLMQGVELELYDLEQDPGETRNLAAQHPQVVADLKRRLFDWIARSKQPVVPEQQAPVEIDERTKESLRALGYLE